MLILWILRMLILIELRTAAAETISRRYSFETRRYSFESSRGTEINGVSWLPTIEPLGLVYISHGYGEHIGNFDALGSTLARAGLAAFGHDHEGHGLSGGERVNIEDFENFVDDVFHGCRVNKMRYPSRKLPVFIFGHSMGGLVALLAVLEDPNYFSGMVLSAPLIQNSDTHGNLNFLNRKLAKVANVFMPSFQAGSPIENSENSRDLEVVKRLDNDPLMWKGSFKARMTVATFRAVDKINEELDLVTTPFLVLHGSDDTIVWPKGSKELFSRAKAKDKQIKILPYMKHHLILDKGRNQVIETVLDWILHGL